jgi:hypothetical protein
VKKRIFLIGALMFLVVSMFMMTPTTQQPGEAIAANRTVATPGGSTLMPQPDLTTIPSLDQIDLTPLDTDQETIVAGGHDDDKKKASKKKGKGKKKKGKGKKSKSKGKKK